VSPTIIGFDTKMLQLITVVCRSKKRNFVIVIVVVFNGHTKTTYPNGRLIGGSERLDSVFRSCGALT
jgi:hypothetical protein